MSKSFGIIDSFGNFGEGAMELRPDCRLIFQNAASRLKSDWEYIDAGFEDGRLDVSDYVLPLWRIASTEMESPILSNEIERFRKSVSQQVSDDRLRNVLMSFLQCCELSGLDVVFSG